MVAKGSEGVESSGNFRVRAGGDGSDGSQLVGFDVVEAKSLLRDAVVCLARGEFFLSFDEIFPERNVMPRA